MSAEPQFAWRVAESTADKTPTVAAPETAGGLLLTPARLRMLAFLPIKA